MNSNNINNTNTAKTSAELQQEVRSSLSDIVRNIGQLKNRLSPGQLIDDAIFYPHKGNPALTFEHLKRNPIGSSFLAIGTMLLMEDERHRSYERNVSERVSRVASAGRVQLSHAAEGARERMDDIKARVSDVKSNISTSMDTVKSKVSGLKGKASTQVSELGETISNSVLGNGSDVGGPTGINSDVSSRVSTTLESARETVTNLDPMAYMAIGLGLGALSGASLPVHEAEQRFVDSKLSGRMADFKRECQAALHESYDVMKSSFMGDVSNFDFNKIKSAVGLDSKNV